MSLLGSIIWFIFGGWLASLCYAVGGLFLCITIVGIPFGIQSFKLALAVLAPFGKEVVELDHANSALRIVFNILWIIFFGWEIAMSFLMGAAVLAITIVGIPFAVKLVKLVPLALVPFGRDLR